MEADKDHYLTSFLNTALPELGLDSDTYTPYVIGLFPSDQVDPNFANEEELDELIELLQSSSETHSDEDHVAVWQQLKKDLLEKYEIYVHQTVDKIEQENEKAELENKRKIEVAKLEAAKQEELMAAQKENQKNAVKDERTAALLDKYGYEDAEEDDNGDKESKSKEKEGTGGVVNNRDHAVQIAKQQRDKVKSDSTKQVESKKAAKEATKNQKAEKIRLKEERRKKAAKGERRR